MSRPRRKERSAPSRPGVHPIVAIVGRPNVGKSTLFNRLAGEKLAIVEDEPGVTRDRHYADSDAFGHAFTLVDTGGFDADSDDPIPAGIRRGVGIAVAEADVIVCLFDGIEGVTPSDAQAVDLLRRSGKPVLWVANKIDKPGHAPFAAELYRLGIDELRTISAQHGRGVSDLLDAIVAALPRQPRAAEPEESERPIRVALVGRPNVGKSSIVNRLLGTDRLLVDDRPGTTRDAIDSHFERGGNHYVLVDTAGMRRKKSVDRGVERWSVLHAVRALDRCDVAVLVMDAAEGPAEQEAKVLGLAVDRGLGVVLALNKWDLVDADDTKKIERAVRDKLSFVPWAPMVRLSAKTGRGLPRLVETVRDVWGARRKRVPTGALNRFFATALETHPPPTQGGRSVRLYFITQAEIEPPMFVISSNHPADVHFSYRRYVVNQLRKSFGFEGVPIVVHYKHKRR